MKRILAGLLIMILCFSCFVGCKSQSSGKLSSSEEEYKVAMITDSGEVTDESFNQATYDACKQFSEENDIDFKYYKPTADSTEARVKATKTAINDGYNIIVVAGYLFAETINECAPLYEDVRFIVLDCSKGDLLSAALGNKYDGNPDHYKLEDQVHVENVYCAIYEEELSGYMAGYAAVKLGYRNLGFMGGRAVPAVQRYGYGYIQGADAAAQELVTTVKLQYAYGGTFDGGNEEVIAACDSMYQGGVEVIFACGGSIYKDVCTAAKNNSKKVIGVDVDQGEAIDSVYGEGMTVTSAMKGLKVTVLDTLDDVINNGNWDAYAGEIDTLGLVSDENPEANYCQISNCTQFNDSFTEEDYKKLVKSIYKGDIVISNNLEVLPETTNVEVADLGYVME